MSFYAVTYDVNLEVVRRRMVELDLDAAAFAATKKGVSARARTIGISHMTLRRLLYGHPISLYSLNRILAGLGLKFRDVVKPIGIADRTQLGGVAA